MPGPAPGLIGVNIRGIVHYGHGDLFPYTTAAQATLDLQALQAMKITIARVFVANHSITHAECATRLSAFLNMAATYGVKVIASLIDLYNTGCNPQGTDGFYVPSGGATILTPAFFQTGYTDDYTAFVQAVVTACRGHSALYAWEVGNELKDDSSTSDFVTFMQTVATTIKGIDPVTRVASGMLSAAHTGLTPALLYAGAPAVDIVTVHAYNRDRSASVDVQWAVANGKHAIVEEFGIAGTGDRSVATAAEVVYWSGIGATGFLQWGFCARGVADNGDGDNSFGWDTIKHSADYDALALVYAAQSAGTVGTPIAAGGTLLEVSLDGPLPTSLSNTSTLMLVPTDPQTLRFGSVTSWPTASYAVGKYGVDERYFGDGGRNLWLGGESGGYIYDEAYPSTPFGIPADGFPIPVVDGADAWRLTITYNGPDVPAALPSNYVHDIYWYPGWDFNLRVMMAPGMMDGPATRVSRTLLPPQPSFCATTHTRPAGMMGPDFAALGTKWWWMWYQTTYVDATGAESPPSTQCEVVVDLTQDTLTINSPITQPGATGWYLYVWFFSHVPAYGSPPELPCSQRYQMDDVPTPLGDAIVLSGPGMPALQEQLRLIVPRVGWSDCTSRVRTGQSVGQGYLHVNSGQSGYSSDLLTVPTNFQVGDVWSIDLPLGTAASGLTPGDTSTGLVWPYDALNGLYRNFDPERYILRASAGYNAGSRPPEGQEAGFYQTQTVVASLGSVADLIADTAVEDPNNSWLPYVPIDNWHYSSPLPAGCNSFRIRATTTVTIDGTTTGHDDEFDQSFLLQVGIVRDGQMKLGLQRQRGYTNGSEYEWTLPIEWDWPMHTMVIPGYPVPWMPMPQNWASDTFYPPDKPWDGIRAGDQVVFSWQGGAGNYASVWPAHITVEALTVELQQTRQATYKMEALHVDVVPPPLPPPPPPPTTFLSGARGLQYA